MIRQICKNCFSVIRLGSSNGAHDMARRNLYNDVPTSAHHDARHIDPQQAAATAQ
jgi:hypothetical protein